MTERSAGAKSASPAPRWVSVTSRMRLLVMAVSAVVAGIVTGVGGSWGYAPLCGWDVAALVFITWVWLAVGGMGAADTAQHATRENPGRTNSDLILASASVASLAAVGFVLTRANSSSGATQDWLAALAVASVVLSWFAVHTLYALRYAWLYYDGQPGGIDFKQTTPPRYVDFAYFAFTVGMTFQVSDTDVQKSVIRSAVLRHALLSYLFGAVILAATINLIVSLGGRGG